MQRRTTIQPLLPSPRSPSRALSWREPRRRTAGACGRRHPHDRAGAGHQRRDLPAGRPGRDRRGHRHRRPPHRRLPRPLPADRGSGGARTTPNASDGIFVFRRQHRARGLAIGDQVKVTGPVERVQHRHADQRLGRGLDRAGPGRRRRAHGDRRCPQPSWLGAARRSRACWCARLDARTASSRATTSRTSASSGRAPASRRMPVEAFETRGAEPPQRRERPSRPPTTTPACSSTTATASASDDAAHPATSPTSRKDTVVRNGDAVTFPAGGSLLSFGFNNWRLQPPTPITDASAAQPQADLHDAGATSAPAAPPRRSAATSRSPRSTCSTTSRRSSRENPNARGADTAEQFAIQKSKIVTAINAPRRRRRRAAGDRELGQARRGARRGARRPRRRAQRRRGLAASGTTCRTPAALHDAAITDFITNAIIYKPAVVEAVGRGADRSIDETVWDIAREPIAQTFKYGKQFVTVVANHFKSKSAAPTRHRQTGQDAFNAERVEQAQVAADVREQHLRRAARTRSTSSATSTRTPRRTRSRSSPTRAGPTSLLTKARGQYTYTFDGELGSLDHVIASPAAADTVTSAAVWSINSPEWVGPRVLGSGCRGRHPVPLERPRPDRGRRRQSRRARHGRHRPGHGQRLPRPHRAVRRRRGGIAALSSAVEADPRRRTRTRCSPPRAT